MEEMHFHRLDAPSLPVILAAAAHFGLTRDETWRAAGDALVLSGGDAYAAGYRDELIGVLALRIIAKHRRRRAVRRGIRLADEPPPESDEPGAL